MTEDHAFLDNLNEFLKYKKEEGVQTLDISPETRALLKKSEAKQAVYAPGSAPVYSPDSPTETVSAELRVTGTTIDEIAAQIKTCAGCELHASRSHAVPGEGNADSPDLLFIGEAPNPDEDAQGRPSVGEAGQLLTKMIGAMGYRREEVFITNIVKCRTPGSRIPLPQETSACMAYLRAQIKLINPKCIVAMGKPAVEGLVGKPVAITRYRGTWSTFEGIDMMSTFHPGYLVKMPSKKREAWSDLQAVMTKLATN